MEAYEKRHRRLEGVERKISNREKEISRYEWSLKQRERERLKHMAINGIRDTSLMRKRSPASLQYNLKWGQWTATEKDTAAQVGA